MTVLNVIADPATQQESPLAALLGPGRASVDMMPSDSAQWRRGLFRGPTGEREFHPGDRVYGVETRGDWVPNRTVEDGRGVLEGLDILTPYRMTDLLEPPLGENVYSLLGVSLFVRRHGPPFPGLAEVPTGRDGVVAYRPRGFMPSAWIVPASSRVSVRSDPEALDLVRTESFDPAADLTLDRELPPGVAASPSPSSVRVISREAETHELAVSLDQDGYLVESEACYPGWTAEVDGVSAPMACADYALRALRLAPGSHRVRIAYRPWSWRIGVAISLVSMLLMLVALRGDLRRRRSSPG
jgi:hypothetical protein